MNMHKLKIKRSIRICAAAFQGGTESKCAITIKIHYEKRRETQNAEKETAIIFPKKIKKNEKK